MTEPAHKARAKLRNAWLLRCAGEAGWRNRAAAGLLVMDGLAAIGFALALAGGVSALGRAYVSDGLLTVGTAPFFAWVALGIVASAARGLCALASARVGAGASARVRLRLRRRLVAACLAHTPDPAATPDAEGGQEPARKGTTGETMTVVVNAVETLDGYVARFLPARQAAVPIQLLVLAATAVASPVAAGILVATLAPFVLVMALAGGAAADESRRQFIALSRLSGLFADRIRHLPLIVAFQAEQRETGWLSVAAEDLRARTMAVLRVAFISSAGLEFFAALSVALVAVYCGFALLHLLPFPAPEHLTLGRALFVLALAPEFYAPMRRLAAAYHDRQAAEAAADRMMALDTAPVPVRAAAPPPGGALPGPPRIRFEDVTIQYPGEDRPVVDRFELDVAPGEMVALLGPSGSGKSSLLNLLLGLAPLVGGEVWIGDRALTELGTLAAGVSWMGQSSLLVPGTILENIALSRRDASHSEIVVAAGLAGLDAVRDNRSGGLEARLDERGGGLSGGERRRIALARALLKPAPILLLDEPTAHLDAGAETLLIDIIRSAARGRTTLIATHSEELAAVADRVVRLDEGCPS